MNLNRANDSDRSLLRKEAENLFSVSVQTLDRLNDFLNEQGRTIPDTSYHFIRDNIADTMKYSARQIKSVKKKCNALLEMSLSSPLILCFFGQGEQNPFFVLRDTVRENAELNRQLIMNIKNNISEVLPAYIFIYETLEKFSLKIPFILVESDDYSRELVSTRFFGAYREIQPSVELEDLVLETITYSGTETGSPEAILLLGHEAFHIVEAYQFLSDRKYKEKPLFDTLIQETGIKLTGRDRHRCREAFVDVLASMYLGPAYGVVFREHFERIYPVSGERHAEIITRLQLVSRIWEMQRYTSPQMDKEKLNDSIERFKRLMNEQQKEDAARDLKNLEILLNKGMVEFIKEFFDRHGVRMYLSFLSFWKKEEVMSYSEIDNMDQAKIMFCLKNNMPVAVRPTILLNILVDHRKELTEFKDDTVVASIKKWYVKRYYQKAAEKNSSQKIVPHA